MRELRSARGVIACGFGFVLSASASACIVPQAFECSTDADCGADGRCEGTGFCAFPDEDCPSGYRYGSLAIAKYASECVEPELGGGESGESGVGDGDGDEQGSDSMTDGDGDGDGDPMTGTEGDGDGDASGDGDGDASGDGDGEPEPEPEGLYLYTFRVSQPSWTREPLAAVLNDDNAPNDVDIVAATRFEVSERLVFVDANNMVYVRSGVSFKAPISLEEWTQGDLPSGGVTAMSQIYDPDTLCEGVMFYLRDVGISRQATFEYCPGDELLTLLNTGQLFGIDAFPQDAQPILFAFARAEVAREDTGWLVTHRALGEYFGSFRDFNVVPFDVSPLKANDFWGVGQGDEPLPNEPSPETVRAAYYDVSGGGNEFLFAVAP